MKVSVIIPVYNVEKYIERCARSLMVQTMKDEIEFIFINDCTPDDSMNRLKRVVAEYPNRKNQVRIIDHSENKGIAYTRGEGIREAQGVYIGWCDSDDWCEPNMFETMFAQADSYKEDIVICDYLKENSTGNFFVNNKNFVDTHVALEKNMYSPYLWHQLIKRSLLQKASSLFVGNTIGEDRFLLMSCYFYGRKMFVVNKPLYHYNERNVDSITRTDRKTYIQWLAQKKNIETIEKVFSEAKNGVLRFSKTLNWLKFFRKSGYMRTFTDAKEYFFTFRECHKDILKYTDIQLKSRLILYVIYLNFYFFRVYCWVTKIQFG